MIYVILGQTASGKTELATKLARKYQLPLIGADAFQIYRELSIGVAKPTASELDGLEAYFIGDVSVATEMNVRVYQKRVRALLDQFAAEGRDVIMSGGTFLYVRAALFPYVFPDTIDNSDFGGFSADELYRRLTAIDPVAAADIHPHNRRRVEQALRIAASGRIKSDLAMKNVGPLYPVRFFGIEVDREDGNRRIDARVDQMMVDGLPEEVKSLLERGYGQCQAMAAIGYKEMIAGLNSGLTPAEIAAKIKLNTRHYAKRQRTFMRHQFPGIVMDSAPMIETLISTDQELKARTRLALGNETVAKIEKARVLIAGLGGVGGSLFEGLIRLGVKEIVVVDMDRVDLSNLNRQTLYVSDNVGKLKTECARAFAQSVNKLTNVSVISDKIVTGYFDTLSLNPPDFIFDCLDDVAAKVELCEYARKQNATLLVATGSGLRSDSTKVAIGRLKDTGEPLAKAYKKELKSRGIEAADILCVYSKEVPAKRVAEAIGSVFTVPNSFGLALLSLFIKVLQNADK